MEMFTSAAQMVRYGLEHYMITMMIHTLMSSLMIRSVARNGNRSCTGKALCFVRFMTLQDQLLYGWQFPLFLLSAVCIWMLRVFSRAILHSGVYVYTFGNLITFGLCNIRQGMDMVQSMLKRENTQTFFGRGVQWRFVKSGLTSWVYIRIWYVSFWQVEVELLKEPWFHYSKSVLIADRRSSFVRNGAFMMWKPNVFNS